MSTQTITTHLSDQRAAQMAQTVVSQFQDVRDASASVEDAQVQSLYARYDWGRSLCNAITDLEETTQTDFCKEVATRLDKSESYVQHHVRFARACSEEFPGFDPPVAGYVAHVHDDDGQLTWSAAIRWMSTSTDQETDKDSEDAHHKMKEVERKIDQLDEAADELAEQYINRGNTLDEEARQAVEGVLTKAQEALEDERHRIEELPVPDEERVECEPYRRWVADHACCNCGVMDDTVVMHHPEHVYADKGGHATKIPDFLGVPLCFECHGEAEGPEKRFWEESQANPYEVAARLQAEWNSKLTA